MVPVKYWIPGHLFVVSNRQCGPVSVDCEWLPNEQTRIAICICGSYGDYYRIWKNILLGAQPYNLVDIHCNTWRQVVTTVIASNPKFSCIKLQNIKSFSRNGSHHSLCLLDTQHISTNLWILPASTRLWTFSSWVYPIPPWQYHRRWNSWQQCCMSESYKHSTQSPLRRTLLTKVTCTEFNTYLLPDKPHDNATFYDLFVQNLISYLQAVSFNIRSLFCVVYHDGNDKLIVTWHFRPQLLISFGVHTDLPFTQFTLLSIDRNSSYSFIFTWVMRVEVAVSSSAPYLS